MRDDLAHRFDRIKEASVVLGGKERLRETRQNSLAAVSEGFRMQSDIADVHIHAGSPGHMAVPEALSIQVTESIDTRKISTWDRSVEELHGSLHARAAGPGGPFLRAARFAQKPWVESFSSFAARHPRNPCLMAVSVDLHASRGEAEEDAYRVAAAALWPQVRDRLHQMHPSFTTDWPPDAEVAMRRRVATSLRHPGWVADRFVQSFDRPYGTVWREALLVDASHARFAPLTRDVSRVLTYRRASVRGTWFSVAVLCGLLLATYFFLNVATQGYYAWALRGLGIVVLGVGAAFILMVG